MDTSIYQIATVIVVLVTFSTLAGGLYLVANRSSS